MGLIFGPKQESGELRGGSSTSARVAVAIMAINLIISIVLLIRVGGIVDKLDRLEARTDGIVRALGGR